MESNFNKGDFAIAITTSIGDDIVQQRITGQSYVVRDVLFCDTTGKQLLNFGYRCDPKYTKTRCPWCGKGHLNRGLSWTSVKQYVDKKTWDQMQAQPKVIDEIVNSLSEEVKKES